MIQQSHFKVYIPKKKKRKEISISQTDICTPMFKKVLFTIAKIWKQHKCSPTINR